MESDALENDALDSDGKANVRKSNDFLQVPRGLSEKSKFSENHPKMEDIRVSKFIRGSGKIFWKHIFDEEHFNSSERNSMKALNGDVKSPLTYPRGDRGIPVVIKEDIIGKLCPLIPVTQRNFWEEVAVNIKMKLNFKYIVFLFT